MVARRTENLGDDIQSLAAAQFLPRVDIYLDRDNLKDIKHVNDNIKVIMNGWFTNKPGNWPPSRVIEPLFISFHISPHIAWKFLKNSVIEYLKRYEPIGCRDIWTTTILNSFGVKAYFSGCLTLTLDYKYSVPRRDEKILLIDLDPKLAKYVYDVNSIKDIKIKELCHYIIKPVSPRIMRVTNNFAARAFKKVKNNLFIKRLRSSFSDIVFSTIDLRRENWPLEIRFKVAEAIIREIASAKLIITSRLHAALPALAFKVPVIFVPLNPADFRFSGYLDYFSIFCHPNQFKQLLAKIDINNLPPPSNTYKLQEIKHRLIDTVRDFLNK